MVTFETKLYQVLYWYSQWTLCTQYYQK